MAGGKGFILHWPAYYKSYIDSKLGVALVNAMRYSHVKGNGWNDIGYHWVVHKDTDMKFKAFDGRSDNWLGAHCYGFNDWLGICVAYPMDAVSIPQEQINAIAKLIATLSKKYKIPISKNTVKAHRDMYGHKSNQCCGDLLYKRINEVIDLATRYSRGETPKMNLPQKPANEYKKEKQIGLIDIDLRPKKGERTVSEGVRINNQGYIHISQLGQFGLHYKYVPKTETQKDKIIISDEVIE